MIGKFLLIITPFFTACNFAPRIHKDILYAQKLVSEHKYALAIEKYKEIVEKNPPNQTQIYYQIGDLYSSYLLQNEDAVEFYQKARDSSIDPIWMIKSEEQIAELKFSFLKDYDGAVSSYKKLTRFVPKLARHHFYEYRLAISYINSSQLTKGFEILNSIQKNSQHDFFIQSLYEMGMYYFVRKQWAQSIAFLERYIKHEKTENKITQAKFLMANAYETMDDLKKAYDVYYSLLATYPNIEVIKNRLSSIYQRRAVRKR